MKILWFSWKDRKNPTAGGAETINEELTKRLVRSGHEVKLVVAGFSGALQEERVYGYTVIRVGNRRTVYWKAYRYYRKHLQGWADLVVDEVNTIPFLCRWYVKERNVLLVYQLCRRIWFYQIAFPLNLIGYLLEPLYLWLLRDRDVITESESTKKDMTRFGFRQDRITVFPIGIDPTPYRDLASVTKAPPPTLLSIGSVRSMKRTADIVRAFEFAKRELPALRLVVAGSASDSYGTKVRAMIRSSRYRDSIQYLGVVSASQRAALMQQAQLLCVTSVKEGWGLVVTEANAQGTPAVVYDVDGLRDSVRDSVTGVVCTRNTPAHLAEQIVTLLRDHTRYQALRKNAWEWSTQFTYEHSYRVFYSAITRARHG